MWQLRSSSLRLNCGHAFSFSRRVSPELCLISPPSNPRGRREGRVPAGTRDLLRERHAQKEPHSSIQVSPITRPSLRSGRTAYAVISREPTIPLASLAPRIWMMQSARLGSLAPSQELDRGNDGQDHTVLPYARPAMSPQYSRTPSTEPETYNETKPSSAVVRTRLRTHRDYPPCPHLSCRRCRVHRNPGSRSRRPRDRPSW